MVLGERFRHRLLLAASLVVSTVWMIVCAVRTCPDQGERGGAIAVAISLFALFANKPHGSNLFDLLMINQDEFFRRIGRESAIGQPPQTAVERLDQLIDALKVRMNVDAEGQESLNWYMALSAVYGTLVWGFGDLVSWRIIYLFHLPLPPLH